MRTRLRASVILLGCLALIGCASNKKFAEADFPLIDADLEILATQQEIETDTSATDPMAAGGGLLGLLIVSAVDSTKNRRAEEAVTPLRDKLVHYSVGERFAEKVRESGVGDLLVSDAEPFIRLDPRQPNERHLDRPVVIIDPNVRFSNDMSFLRVALDVLELEPNENGRLPKRGVWQTYGFIWPLESERRMSRDQNALVWNAWSADELIELIERGMDQTLHMLAAHIDEPELILGDSQTRLRLPIPGNFRLWRNSEDFKWVAFGCCTGSIYAVPDHAIRRN